MLPENHEQRYRGEVCKEDVPQIGGTGKARLPTPTVVTVKDGGTISCSEVDDRSLDRDGTSLSDAGEVGRQIRRVDR